MRLGGDEGRALVASVGWWWRESVSGFEGIACRLSVVDQTCWQRGESVDGFGGVAVAGERWRLWGVAVPFVACGSGLVVE